MTIPPVPAQPEDAQQVLFLLLGAAIAQAQIAEAKARGIHQFLLGHKAPPRATLGSTVRGFRDLLPPEVASDYNSLVERRNYLAHEVLSDCGGWAGLPELDPPSKYSCLYEKIVSARAEIQRVDSVLNQYLVDLRTGYAVFEFGTDGVRQLQPRESSNEQSPH
ncbi:hypothetical protein [Actinotalea subterranea]|uniref:hypothetical protein n=1 Tax=Actinotalea subterranea TaxID=2607497 RepID=UPI0011EBB7D0|nr:hypothetical protein [Actinotalea subterranea]